MDAQYAYETIDRFLRNNLGDDDYAEYSEALDALCSPPSEFLGIPVEYQYQYPGLDWRCSNGDTVNGLRPTASRALYAKKDGT